MNSVFLNDNIDLKGYLENPDPALSVRPAEYWEDELIHSLTHIDDNQGSLLPWEECDRKFRLRRGEMTVWGGENGSGKSFVTSQVALSLAEQGDKSVIASFELTPKATLQRMACQHFKVREWRELDPAQVQSFLTRIRGRIWIYNQLGRVDTEKLIGVMRWSKKTLDVNHFFIDSLMMIVNGSDNDQLYNSQKNIVHELSTLAKDLLIHVHLVAHFKKPESGKKASKYSVSGSANITDLADNVILIENMTLNENVVMQDDPDMWLTVDKQRHAAFRGTIPLFMLNQMYCFSGSKHRALPRGSI